MVIISMGMIAKEYYTLRGHYIFTKREALHVFLLRKLKSKWLVKKIKNFLYYFPNLETKLSEKYCKVLSVSEYDNVTCNVGKNAIAADLAGDSTYKSQVTYIAVGTGAGTPAATDTTLFTELARVANSVDGATANVATIQGFFNSATGNGVLTEMGAFGNGSATQASAAADSGILFSHVAISETKTIAETLTCQFTLTIT